MPPKVQIFLSEQAKKNANAPKKLGKNAGRPKIQLKSPARNASAAKNAKPKGKVVKSAARPIQKMSNVKIVQPTKGAMQPGSSENKSKVIIIIAIPKLFVFNKFWCYSFFIV